MTKKIESGLIEDRMNEITQYLPEDLKDHLEDLVTSYLDENGYEVNNPKPLFIEAELNGPMTLAERIDWILRKRLSRGAQDDGFETEEEAEDFDIPDPEHDVIEDSIYQEVLKHDETIALMEEDIAQREASLKKEPSENANAESSIETD